MSLSRIHQKLGTAGFIIAIVALVAALGGGAYAASNALNGKQKKEVEKIAKKYAGAPGKNGATGPAGANGKDGSNGAAGEKGAQGIQGVQGNPGVGTKGDHGEAGKSVVSETVLAEPGGACGEEVGGVEYEVEESAETTVVCSGEKGEKGEKGDEGNIKATLPEGVIETGTWYFTRSVQKITVEVGGNTEEIEVGDTSEIAVPISLAVPLASPIETEEHVHVQGEEHFAEFCEKNAGNPKPKVSGDVCIYGEWSGTTFQGANSPGTLFPHGTEERRIGRPGAVLFFSAPTGDAEGSGSFAVKG